MQRARFEREPPLAAEHREGKYKEFFICAPLLPVPAFRLFAARTGFFREFHVANVTNSPGVETRGGSFEEGLANGRKLLGSHPAVALQQAQTLIRFNSDPRAFHLAAAAHRRLGDAAAAEEAELAGIRVSFAVRELDDAAVAGQGEDMERPRALINDFLRQQPDNLLALTMAAELDLEDSHLNRAEERLKAVLQRAPSFLRAIMLLAKCNSSQGRVQEAIKVIRAVLDRKPDNLIALRNLSQAYAEANRHEEAAEAYRHMLTIDPTQLDVATMHAHELRMLGRKAEAKAAFRHALELDPKHGAAWWGLANFFPEELTAADIDSMKATLSSLPESAEDRGPLNVALGLLAERAGDRPEAFARISEGKRHIASSNPFDADAESAKVEGLIRSQSPDQLAALLGAGCADKSPIFVIGMPRSGTTLLERILGRHSQIEPCGELPIIARMASGDVESSAARTISRWRTGEALTSEELAEAGTSYIDHSHDYRLTDKPFFIDKNNFNWYRVGLIRMMLPNARIIDMRRDPLDCCWANFKMMFAKAHSAANDQRNIARFYRDYVRMVEAIDAAAPGGILKVRYEELVDDVEQQTRRILDFLGLEYEPECIDFHLASEAVATPSSEQVRRPINRDSIGSAQPYREWLGPMIEELGELAD